ncbi:hypothetical protein BD779DRAFT_1048305 [Infundibulicybe gibba]|nr:hypothetical protein BD779DRAFT_1048305 [Infundibulicybe gibba]
MTTPKSPVQDSPPAYDNTVGENAISHPATEPLVDVKEPQPTGEPQPYVTSGVPYTIQPCAHVQPTIYHYTHPTTNDHVVSLLPPDHPEMICLQAGEHQPKTRFGVVGILAAIFWFPLGVGLCLLDRKVKCQRCGKIIEDGVCG